MRLARKTRQWLRWTGVICSLGLLSLLLIFFWGLALIRQAMDRAVSEAKLSRVFARSVTLYRGASWPCQELFALLRAANFPTENCSVPKAFTVCRDGTSFLFGEGLQEHTEEPVRVQCRPEGLKIGTISGTSLQALKMQPSLLAIVPKQDAVRWPVPLTEVSPHLVNAVVDLEDRGFLSHSGLSLRGLLRATAENLIAGKVKQGGSTISQQVVKNLLLRPERRMARKMLEGFLAAMLEYSYTKAQILEAYLNNAYYGQDGNIAVVGVEAASRFYFGKPARYLSLEEATLLAGMLAAPNRFDPRKHPQSARQRRAQALAAMVAAGHLSSAEAEKAALKDLPGKTWPLRWSTASHFLDLLPKERATGEIRTTLDPLVQQAIFQGVKAGLQVLDERQPGLADKGDPLQVAVVVLDRGGAVLGLLGSREGRPGELNRALVARRPIGSLVKPFLVATALQRGWTLDARLLDEPLEVRWQRQIWSPQNHDGRFRGSVTLEEALVHSINVPMVRLGLALGLSEVTALLRQLGFAPPGTPSQLLGAVEATPLEVATAYTPFLTGGTLVVPWAWEKAKISSRRVFAKESVSGTLQALRQVVERGTAAGFAARGQHPLAGKTGTTDKRRDSWFVGLRPQMVTVVWVGTDQNQSTDLYGATGAGVVWQEIDRRLPTAYKGGLWTSDALP